MATAHELSSRTPNNIAGRLLIVSTAAVAVAALALMLVPKSYWHHADTSASYFGFDQNLIHTDPTGGGSATGSIVITPGSVQMQAAPGSRPTADLVSSDLDFNMSGQLRVSHSDSATAAPLTLKIWSPRENTSYSLEFGPAPANEIRAVVAVGSKTDTTLIGSYSTGVLYNVNLGLNRSSQVLSIGLGAAQPPPAVDALSLTGGPSEPGYTEVNSSYVRVTRGHQYTFGGTVTLVHGADSYKVVLDWFDGNKKKIAYSNDWRPVRELTGWTPRTFSGTAPAGAAYARLILGAGNGRTQVLMTNLFIAEAGSPTANLLPNGDFRAAAAGWTLAGASSPQEQPRIIKLSQGAISTTVDSRAAPALFYKLPVAVTLLSNSDSGVSSVDFVNYRVTIPAQLATLDRLQDPRATLAMAVLAVLFTLLGIGWLLRIPRDPARSVSSRVTTLRASAQTFIDRNVTRGPIVALAFGVAYFLANCLLFGLGSHSYDMAGQKIWSYVSAYYGQVDLLYLPSTVAASSAFGGTPFAGVPFPYGPAMTWVFAAVGWAYRLFGVGSTGPTTQGYELEFLIKAVNVGFTLIDGLLIYLIVRGSGASVRTGRVAVALFLLNPAVWFLTSVWGETQTVTLSVLLGAILAAQRSRPTLAWILIGIAILSRPQLVVPGVILGLFLLRWFQLRANLLAVAWMTIAVTVVLAPLLFTLGPSLPVSYLINLIHTQGVTDPHAAQYNYVSYDGYSIWPLVTGLASGQVGKSRIYYPESSLLVSGYTYREIATFIGLPTLALMAYLAVFRGKLARTNGTYITLLAAATLAELLLDTGVSAQHFVIALALVILSITGIRRSFYYPLVTALSVTTLVSMYGSLGFDISAGPSLAPALAPQTNAITRWFMNLFTSDQFITAAVLANSLVLIAMISAHLVGRNLLRQETNRALPLEALPPTEALVAK